MGNKLSSSNFSIRKINSVIFSRKKVPTEPVEVTEDEINSSSPYDDINDEDHGDHGDHRDNKDHEDHKDHKNKKDQKDNKNKKKKKKQKRKVSFYEPSSSESSISESSNSESSNSESDTDTSSSNNEKKVDDMETNTETNNETNTETNTETNNETDNETNTENYVDINTKSDIKEIGEVEVINADEVRSSGSHFHKFTDKIGNIFSSKKSNVVKTIKKGIDDSDESDEEDDDEISTIATYTDVMNGKKSTYKNIVTIDIDVDTPNGEKNFKVEIDEDVFVKMTIDYMLSIRGADLSYLIGYKMVYMVDHMRRKIPGVIAIVTLKVPRDKNSIYKSEYNRWGSKIKPLDSYEMIDFSQKHYGKYYDRDSQANSLKHGGNGDFVAWNHATKYCAYAVETLAITLIGKLQNVIVAGHLYDDDKAFAESAFTFDEKQEPVLYEVGFKNKSKNDRPVLGIGKCLDFFHFFLHPQYAIDYGFHTFLMEENKNNINMNDLVMSKKFSDCKKVSYFKHIQNSERFVKDDSRNRVSKTRKTKISKIMETNKYLFLRGVEQDKKNENENNEDDDMKKLEEELA